MEPRWVRGVWCQPAAQPPLGELSLFKSQCSMVLVGPVQRRGCTGNMANTRPGQPKPGLGINRLRPIGALSDGTRDAGRRTPAPRASVSCPPEFWTESHPCSAFLGHQQVSVGIPTHSYTYTHTLSFAHALIKPTHSHTTKPLPAMPLPLLRQHHPTHEIQFTAHKHTHTCSLIH